MQKLKFYEMGKFGNKAFELIEQIKKIG